MGKACEIAAELIARAEEHGSAERIADAANWLASARALSGEFELAAEGFDRSWALLESIAKPAAGLAQQRAGLMPQARTFQVAQRLRSQTYNRVNSAWNLWSLGYPDRALERVIIATSIARESGSKAVLEDAHAWAIFTFDARRELEHMRERAEAAVELSTELGNRYRRPYSEFYVGLALALAGDLEGGIARMRQHLSELRATGSELGTPYLLGLIGTALGRLRRFDEGLRSVDEAFLIIERTGQRCWEAEAHRVKGELLIAQDASNAAQAEQSLRTAI